MTRIGWLYRVVEFTSEQRSLTSSNPVRLSKHREERHTRVLPDLLSNMADVTHEGIVSFTILSSEATNLVVDCRRVECSVCQNDCGNDHTLNEKTNPVTKGLYGLRCAFRPPAASVSSRIALTKTNTDARLSVINSGLQSSRRVRQSITRASKVTLRRSGVIHDEVERRLCFRRSVNLTFGFRKPTR